MLEQLLEWAFVRHLARLKKKKKKKKGTMKSLLLIHLKVNFQVSTVI